MFFYKVKVKHGGRWKPGTITNTFLFIWSQQTGTQSKETLSSSGHEKTTKIKYAKDQNSVWHADSIHPRWNGKPSYISGILRESPVNLIFLK